MLKEKKEQEERKKEKKKAEEVPSVKGIIKNTAITQKSFPTIILGTCEKFLIVILVF
jgi:hypothetical protein